VKYSEKFPPAELWIDCFRKLKSLNKIIRRQDSRRKIKDKGQKKKY
jgi:hypothetical protein